LDKAVWELPAAQAVGCGAGHVPRCGRRLVTVGTSRAKTVAADVDTFVSHG
jgi:hypothetical protein